MLSSDDIKASHRSHGCNASGEGKALLSFMLRASVFCSSHILPESYTAHSVTGSAAAGDQCLSGVGSTSDTTALSVLMWMAAWSRHHLPVALSFHASNQGHGPNTRKIRAGS